MTDDDKTALVSKKGTGSALVQIHLGGSQGIARGEQKIENCQETDPVDVVNRDLILAVLP